ncbi:hypothetical protein [Corynebacterium sp. AOP12-C2-36]|uniref:hypothetical protein n=1 Tax=Corynebacterium sp. AOP12-C2-36 TaxID=3457723 RepID=UPI0040342DCA
MDSKNDRWVWVETHPDQCPNGHPWTVRGAFRPGWVGGTGEGAHRMWECQACDGIVHDDGCSWGSVSVRQADLARTNLARAQR